VYYVIKARQKANSTSNEIHKVTYLAILYLLISKSLNKEIKSN